MTEKDKQSQAYVVLGQKYAYATLSLVLGILSCMSLFGLEKPILAIILAWLALRQEPEPILRERRLWAKTGLILGAIILIVVPSIILLNIDRLYAVIEAFTKLQEGK